MSLASDPNAKHPTYQDLNPSTVAAIQKKVTKLGKRNAASRIIHAKSDKTMIATWKQDLIRVLQVFNVSSVGSSLRSLTASFQTELAINTNIMVADMHRNALKNHGAPRPHPKASPKPPSSGLTPTNLDVRANYETTLKRLTTGRLLAPGSALLSWRGKQSTKISSRTMRKR